MKFSELVDRLASLTGNRVVAKSKLEEYMATAEAIRVGTLCRVGLGDDIVVQRAQALIRTRRPIDFDAKTGLYVYPDKWEDEEVVYNVKIDAGFAQYHKQLFGTAGLNANGMNYIANSNDAVTETNVSTTLSNEIAANGLTRAQGTVVLATGTGRVTTIEKVFTCATASQSSQKSCLFDAAAAGSMNHVLGYVQRTLQIGDQLDVQFSITAS